MTIDFRSYRLKASAAMMTDLNIHRRGLHLAMQKLEESRAVVQESPVTISSKPTVQYRFRTWCGREDSTGGVLPGTACDHTGPFCSEIGCFGRRGVWLMSSGDREFVSFWLAASAGA